MIKLYTKRLLIRDYIMEDLPEYHKLLSCGSAMKYLPFLKTSTLEESKKCLQETIDDANSDNRKHYSFCMENILTKEYIGSVGYNVKDNTSFGKMVTIVYFIHKKYWNNGYVTEAMKETIKYAFKEGNVYRFIGECIKDNIGSEKVMIKCGMIKEGDFIEYALYEGKLKDYVQYRLLKHEWDNVINKV